MFRRIEERFGKAGLVVSVIALIFALGGSAYALTSADKKLVKKEAKKWAKKYAKPGAPGAPGATGPAGANGKDGANGTNGTNGANGKSVTVAEIPAGEPECAELGGAEVKQEGAAEGVEVCNGEEGSPWTAGGTLPSGETETGTWSLQGATDDSSGLLAPISFTIPLAAPIVDPDGPGPEGNWRYITSSSSAEDKEKCDDGVGTAGSVSNPEADPGFLCVFQGRKEGTAAFFAILDPTANEVFGASKSGALVFFLSGGLSIAYGTWAVTAP